MHLSPPAAAQSEGANLRVSRLGKLSAPLILFLALAHLDMLKLLPWRRHHAARRLRSSASLCSFSPPPTHHPSPLLSS